MKIITIMKSAIKMSVLFLCAICLSTTVAKAETINISTVDDMQKLQYVLEGDKIVLTNNIDMISYGLWESPDIKGVEFDGQGHTIKNLTSTKNGLFYTVTESYIHDLRLQDVNIKGIRESSDFYIGGVAGRAVWSTIEKCSVAGKIASASEVGGIVDWSHGSVITECRNEADISSDDGSVGGIVGWNQSCSGEDCYWCSWFSISGDNIRDAEVSNCVNYGSVRGEYAGGIIGNLGSGSKLWGCVSNGDVYGSEYYGGIAGYVASDSYIYNSFCNSSTCIGKSEMTYQSVISVQPRGNSSDYKGLDWNVWMVSQGINNGAPFLKWTSKDYRLETPFANMNSGKYSRKITVSLKCSVPNAKLYYTVDGKKPTNQSKLYTGTLTISKNTKLRVVAYLDGFKPSKVATYKYKFSK